MSAIGGMLRRDGAPLDISVVAGLGRALERRGPDGGGEHLEASVALVHRAFHVLPTPFAELQPVRSARGAVLTWDGRLDNGSELRGLLELTGSAHLTDADVVLAAYERWGLDCLPRLVGDFALALWDARTSTLALARDAFGVRPLFYRLEPGRLLWATRLTALLEASNLSAEPDEEWIGDYLTYAPPLDRTPYRGLLALPPGHCLEVTRQKTRLFPFWRLRPGSEPRLATDAEYEERFRQLFTEAVQVRSRTRGAVFAEVSGGVDSSSVACVARRLIADGGTPASDLHTVSFTYEHSRTSDESPFIRAVEEWLGRPGLHIGEEHLVLPSPAAPSPEVPTYTHCFRGQYDRLGELMRERGARVLLTGFGGDALCWGEVGAPLELADLLRQRQLGALVRSLRTWRQVQDKPYLQLLWEGGLRPLLPTWVQRWLRPARPVPEWVAPGFARRIDLGRRPHEFPRSEGFLLPSQRAHGSNLLSNIDALSWHYACNGATVMDVTHPFLHRPLVEFCLAVPLSQLVRGQETRSLHRRALRGLLPDKVARRRSKQGPDEAYHRALARQWAQVELLLEDARIVQRGYVEPASFRAVLQQARFGLGLGLLRVFKALALEYWLRSIEAGRLGPD